jgi:Fic family protein
VKPFFERQDHWDDAIGRIYAALERVKLAEAQATNRLVLRRDSRIRSVWSSVAIEGNRLTPEQAAAVGEGHSVFGPARDVAEFQGTLAAYEAMDSFDPYSVSPFLEAHRLVMTGLLPDAGAFRTVDVEVVNAAGEVLHEGAAPELVEQGMSQLLEWARDSDVHPLLTSSAVHFMIEYIHPFRDGNGRMGRLWQTLLLSRWNELFAWTPTETLVHDSQLGYYQALQESHNGRIEASPFISFMLTVIEASLGEYSTAVGTHHEGRNEGRNEGRTVRPDGVDRLILHELTRNPTLTTVQLAEAANKSEATVERHLAKLKAAALLHRSGPTKNGVWVVSPDWKDRVDGDSD